MGKVQHVPLAALVAGITFVGKEFLTKAEKMLVDEFGPLEMESSIGPVIEGVVWVQRYGFCISGFRISGVAHNSVQIAQHQVVIPVCGTEFCGAIIRV